MGGMSESREVPGAFPSNDTPSTTPRAGIAQSPPRRNHVSGLRRLNHAATYVDQAMANPADVAHRGRHARCVVDTRQGGAFGWPYAGRREGQPGPEILEGSVRLPSPSEQDGSTLLSLLSEVNEKLLAEKAAKDKGDG
jgi:hypothetical protein